MTGLRKPTKREMLAVFYGSAGGKRAYAGGYSFAANWIVHQVGGKHATLLGLWTAYRMALEVAVQTTGTGSYILIDGWNFTWEQLAAISEDTQLAAAIMIKERESDLMEQESRLSPLS